MKTMNNLNKTKIFFLVIAAITITSCNNDDEPVNEEALMNVVTFSEFRLASDPDTISFFQFGIS